MSKKKHQRPPYQPTPFRYGDDQTISVLYDASRFFQLHKDPNFNAYTHPLATKNNLDLGAALANARGAIQNVSDFYNNAAAVKITAPGLKTIIKSALSRKISNDPTPTQNAGHSEKFALGDALNELIGPRPHITPPSLYSRSSDEGEKIFEVDSNFFRRADEIRGVLEEKEATVQVASERIPCEYGKDNCRTFLNRALPRPNSNGERSNVGHIANTQGIFGGPNEKAADLQAAVVQREYNALVSSHNQYIREKPRKSQSTSDQQSTFTIPNPPIRPVDISDRNAIVKTFYSQNSSSRPNSRFNLELGANSPSSDDSSDDSSPLNQRSTPRKNSKITDYSDFQKTSVDSPMLNITNLINSPIVSSYSPTITPSPSFDYSSGWSSSSNDYTGTPLMSNRVGYKIPGVTGDYDYTAAAERFKLDRENLLK